MPNMNALLNSTITVTDTTITPNPQIITRNQNNPTLAATSVMYEPFFIVGTSLVTLLLPILPLFIVYVRNLHATANVLVQWTPNLGGPTGVGILGPGGLINYFNTSSTPGTAIQGIVNGVTTLSFQASAASVPIEVLVAG